MLERRAFLSGLLGAVALGACTSKSPVSPFPSSSPTPPALTPDQLLIEALIAREVNLGTLRIDVGSGTPAASAVALVQHHHQLHVDELSALLPASPSPTAWLLPSASASATASGRAPTSVAQLAAGERSAAIATLDTVAAYQDPTLAALAASIAASGAQHAALLSRLPAGAKK